MRIRVIFFGTAELACASLRELAENSQFQVVAVVTQPDKPRGRDLRLHPSAVKVLALEKQLSLLQPVKARDPAFLKQVQDLAPDLMVVAAYGQILPQALLDLARFGALNVHTSILPRYRGAAPIQWAILQGDAETGVTIMKMDAGLDTGPIVAVEKTAIAADETSQTLHDRLATMGAALLVRSIPAYISGTIQPVPQPAEGTYARKITREDGLVEWSLAAEEIERRLRAFTPWPGAFTYFEASGSPRLLKIWRAQPRSEPTHPTSLDNPGVVLAADREGIRVACGQGSLLITELQREGSRRMSAAEFLAGQHLHPGQRLGQNS